MGMGSRDCAVRRAGALRTSPAVPEAFRISRRVIVLMADPPLTSTAEIEPADVRVVAQHRARPFRADSTHRQNIRPSTQRERLPCVLLDEQDAETTRVDLADPVEH